MLWKRCALFGVVLIAAATANSAVAEQRVLVCHMKDHQVGQYTDHVGPCTPEELLAGGRNVTVFLGALMSRHGINS